MQRVSQIGSHFATEVRSTPQHHSLWEKPHHDLLSREGLGLIDIIMPISSTIIFSTLLSEQAMPGGTTLAAWPSSKFMGFYRGWKLGRTVLCSGQIHPL